MRTSAELRESYLAFFEEKDHLRLPSASLIPVNDPTLLLIGAGMAPFKSYFRGEEKPPHPRVATSQKCLRADDANVGVTARHFTFFEMLGNFSFGDYFKREAIAWAWEFLTERMGFERSRLWVTIHPDDDEAHALWADEVKVPVERISRLEDNFWGPIGATGPCGPCSEIYVDQGPTVGCGRPECKPGCDCDRYLEIWNLVFTGLNKEEDGTFTKLPRPCIDTGMGLERLTFLTQGKANPYETDLFSATMAALKEISGRTLDEGGRVALALKIVADHTRGVIFLLADGISPSNEGRGYVLRRLLRRAVRFGRVLGVKGPFLERLVAPVVATYGDVYPELRTRELHVTNVLAQEQEQFLRTLEQGMGLLDSRLNTLQETGAKTLPGPEVFKLYDTYGFPWELTREIAAERGFEADLAGFEDELEKQRERSRASRVVADSATRSDIAEQPTEFLGYQTTQDRGRVRHIFRNGEEVDRVEAGEAVEVILDRTPFYAEGGGQVGDTGFLTGKSDLRVEIDDTQKGPHDTILHRGRVATGALHRTDEVEAAVDERRRAAIMRHHTATHLLQAALRQVVGAHVTQTGSHVGPERLRFDYSHYTALTLEQIEAVERLVNEEILRNAAVDKREMSMAEAMELGALAFFEEKYADRVRVVTVPNFSRELCGGTHCARTGDIGTFKITSESAIAAGQRRIEAVCGLVALEAFRTYEQILRTVSQDLKTSVTDLPTALERLREHVQRAERRVQELNQLVAGQRAEDLIRSVTTVEGVSLLAAEVEGATADDLRSLSDRLCEKMQSGVVVLGTKDDGTATLICKVTKDLAGQRVHAGRLLQSIIDKIGGKGGGRPDMAQGGGKRPEGLPEALQAVPRALVG